MELIYPKSGARIFVPTELNGNRGKVVFSATHRNKDAVIFWTIDDRFAGKTQQLHQLAIDPGPGKHQLNLSDQDGNSIGCQFFIVDK